MMIRVIYFVAVFFLPSSALSQMSDEERVRFDGEVYAIGLYCKLDSFFMERFFKQASERIQENSKDCEFDFVTRNNKTQIIPRGCTFNQDKYDLLSRLWMIGQKKGFSMMEEMSSNSDHIRQFCKMTEDMIYQ